MILQSGLYLQIFDNPFNSIFNLYGLVQSDFIFGGDILLSISGMALMTQRPRARRIVRLQPPSIDGAEAGSPSSVGGSVAGINSNGPVTSTPTFSSN